MESGKHYVQTRYFDNVKVELYGEKIPDEEVKAYIHRGEELHPGLLEGLELCVDGDFVDITYKLKPHPFERIRRITGYLVGTMDRWNDAKKAEEHDRVKHGVSVPSGNE